MDRSDERKPDRTDEDETPAREGDVLGLGGAAVPKAPGDPTTAHDPHSVAQRRARAREGEVEGTTARADTDKRGATGIDMGAGGQGTDVSGE
jgi:hypothetical protein